MLSALRHLQEYPAYTSVILYDVEVKYMQNENSEWVLCPICNNKTRTKLRKDTELKNFPLFCPKCKNETLINAKQFNITVIKEPDAKTQEPN